VPGPGHTAAEPSDAVTASPEPGVGEALGLYTPAQAAQLLTVRESWLRRKAAARAVPCTLLGRHLRFSAADLRAITTAGARPARAPRGRPRHR
jgi:excisionase family DNA binding protein